MNFKKTSNVIASLVRGAAIFAVMFGFAALAACGDDSSSNSSDDVIAVNENGAIECNDKNEGVTFKIKRDSIFDTFMCEDGQWVSDFGGDDGLVDTSSIVMDSLEDDRDGQIYKTVSIGSQTWMAENLNYRFMGKTSSLDSSSFCYNDSTKYCEKYGRLYLWSAAMDSIAEFSTNGKDCGYGKSCKPKYPVRGICPKGWHLPTRDEWETLFSAVGSSKNAGFTLKSSSGWANGGNGAKTSSLEILPAGFRGNFGDCSYETYYADLWTSTEDDEKFALFVGLDHNDNDADFDDGMKLYGFSVRCIKD